MTPQERTNLAVVSQLKLPDRVVFRAHVVEDPGAVNRVKGKVVKLGG